MTHQELIEDLAETMDPEINVVISEVPLGSKTIQSSVGVPDLFVMRKSYRKPDIRIYEVKRTIGDLATDIRSQKYQRYEPYCDRLYFALGPECWCPKAEELLRAENVGIMIRGTKGWCTIRVAPRREREPLSEMVVISLMMNGRRRDPQGRVSRMERVREELLKKEIQDLRHARMGDLSEAAKQLIEDRESLENLRLETRRVVMGEIRLELGLSKRWYADDTAKEIFEEVVFQPARAAALNGMTKLEELK